MEVGQGPNWGSSAKEKNIISYIVGQSKCPLGLRHGLSSPAQTVGSRARITLEAWVYVCVCVCVYSVCAVLCV
jgi:hypothetical protein